jgi:sigma-E factor negative regulatory protein RseC
METATATVVRVDDGRVTVSVDRAAVCPRCAAGKGCGAGLFAGPAGPLELKLDVSRGVLPRAGDAVTLSLAPRRLLQASFLAYGLPLLGLVAGATLAMLVLDAPTELPTVVLAGAGMLMGLAWARRLLPCADRYLPVIEIEET